VTNLQVCSQKIVPIFSFFFVLAGTLWALVTSPLRVFKEARPLRVFKEARPLRVFKEARPLRVFKEARPDFGYFNYGPEKTKVFFSLRWEIYPTLVLCFEWHKCPTLGACFDNRYFFVRSCSS
jgi:hypothetical protein